jgi:NADH-quinone oxidoreductase subunit A
MLQEYVNILIIFFFSFCVAIILYFLSYFLVLKNYDIEKISAYECGFDPFENARIKFDVRFYLVAILFIIMDLEIMYLFPWLIALKNIDYFGFWTMIIFLVILGVGFLYEWGLGALDWE